jgi:hypothetical protein
MSRSSVLTAIFVAVSIITLMNSSEASWIGNECFVADPTGTSLNVRSSPDSAANFLTQLQNGTPVGIISIDADSSGRPWAEVGLYTNGGWKNLGWVFANYLDCTASILHSEYPLLFFNLKDLIDFGIRWPTTGAASDLGIRCPYQGDKHTLSLSRALVERYTSKQFSLDKLCLMLATGRVRFDPRSGRRLPTYLFPGWPSYGFHEEFLLDVPECFREGAIHGMGTHVVSFRPTGCQLNYHPWSGRKLNQEEADAYAQLLEIAAGGDSASDPIPDTTGATPVTPDLLAELKTKYTSK